jgi:hypothetical protein
MVVGRRLKMKLRWLWRMRKFVMVEEVVVMDDEKVCYGGEVVVRKVS